jgi:CheY-like chemotaxis protein
LPTQGSGGRAARTSAPRIAPAAVRPLRVLVVEDNQDGAEMLQAMLGAWGHETRVAGDGASAIEAAKAFNPEVVLLDIGLPQMSGHDVATHLRSAPGGESMLLIAITGWGQEADRKKSELAGIDHHLLKPVDPALLRNLLEGFGPGSPAPVRGSHPQQ